MVLTHLADEEGVEQQDQKIERSSHGERNAALRGQALFARQAHRLSTQIEEQDGAPGTEQ